MIIQTNLYGDSNLGLHGFATDKYCLLGVKPKNSKLEEVLGVNIFSSSVYHTSLAGIFIAGNSSGIVVPEIIEDYELPVLKKFFSRILVVGGRHDALGNLVLMNDHGIILSPLLKVHKKEIREFFSLPCEISTVAGLNVVGTAALATNRSCIAHPKIKDKEIEVLESVLKVKVSIGTVGFGSPFVKAGIIANSKGALVSDASTGIELGNVDEALLRQ